MKRNLLVILVVMFAMMFVSFSAFAGEISYKIVRGDTLIKIAEKHYGKGMWRNHKMIAKYNGIKNPDRIFAGRTILIPDLGSAKKIESVSSVKMKNIEETGKVIPVTTEISNVSPDKSVIVKALEKSEPVVTIGEIQEQSKKKQAKEVEKIIPGGSESDELVDDAEITKAFDALEDAKTSAQPESLKEVQAIAKDDTVKVSSDEKKGDSIVVLDPPVEKAKGTSDAMKNAILKLLPPKKDDTSSIVAPLVEKTRRENLEGSTVKVEPPIVKEKVDLKKMAYDGFVRIMYGCTDLSHCQGIIGGLNLFNESTKKENGISLGGVVEPFYSTGYTKDVYEGETDKTDWSVYGFRVGPSVKYVDDGFGDRKYQLVLNAPLQFQALKNKVKISIPAYEYNQELNSEQKSLLWAPSLELAVALNKKTILGGMISARLPLVDRMSADNSDLPKTNLFFASLDTYVERKISDDFTVKLNLTPIFRQESNGHLYGSGASIELKWNDWIGLRFSSNFYPWGVTEDMKARGVSQCDITNYDGSIIFYLGDSKRSLKQN